MATEFRRQQQLRGSPTDWGLNNIVVLHGEFALEFDGTTWRMKLGNGLDTYADLPFVGETDPVARADNAAQALALTDLTDRVGTLETSTGSLGALQAQVDSNTAAIATRQPALPTPTDAGNVLYWDGTAYQTTLFSPAPATGMMFYWDATAGAYASIAAGSPGQALVWSVGGIPVWTTNPAAGVAEAPLDSRSYVRANGAWTVLPALQAVNVLTVSTTGRALVASDAGGHVRCGNAADVTMVVPLDATVPFPVGTRVLFEKTGAGDVVIDNAIGVTVNTRAGFIATIDLQFGVATLTKVGTDEWTLAGDLAT